MHDEVFNQQERDLIINAKTTIKKHLEDFVLTIAKLSTVTTLVHKNFYVTGGCIGCLLRNEVPKDYDVYFRTEKVSDKVTSLYLTDSFKNEVEVIEEKYRDTIITIGPDPTMCITENAMTLKNGIQIITKHHGPPHSIRASFDYKHCLPYYDSADDTLYISREQFDLNVKKILRVNNKANVTVYRLEKFKNRGWTEDTKNGNNT